jgi:subtilisin-like proprotein convertase family protein
VERTPVPAATRAARLDLADDLGALGEVRADGKSGGVAYVGRSDRLLTAPSSRPPREIVLDYVQAHDDVFGLDQGDIANLELVARSVSPDGIVHLRFNQVLDGILSFDSGIDGHVTADGRLINVSGAPVPGARLSDTDPTLGARAGLREAREAVEGAESLPATTEVSAGPERTTTFAGGERAILRWSAAADGPRLAWSVIADGGGERSYDVLVDAESGALLRRQDLTSDLGQARYFGVDPLQTPNPIEITMPPAWYDDNAGGTRLWGQYARTYIDGRNESPAPGEEQGGERVQIPASSGAPAAPDWLYEQSTDFPGASPCPPSGCTWNNLDEESSEVNQFQAATNAHVIVSRFHDYLEGAPIGFDEASGNFQRTNTSGSGVGNDYVRVEVNDSGGRNNANFFAPPDGIAPRMQLYLRTNRDVNSSDQADVIYHEYGHGLSNRLVVNASGSSALSGFQSRMMGEAWSDFYSLDLLVHEGHIPDTPAPGEVQIGYYANSPGGVRYKPIDCPVNPTETTAACNGTPTLVGQIRGGYTYGDIVPIYRLLTSPPFAPLYDEGPHDGSEIWGETLWDIRTALGRQTALALITGGMRLSVDNPSMLDMRDAILQQAVAMRSAPGAPDDHYEALWEIFAKRGMGADAATRSAGSTTPSEGFGLVSAAGSPSLTDPYPGGDNDGTIEPGEQFEISQELRAVTSADVEGVSGTLASGSGGTVVDGTAAWPLLGGDREAANGDPLVARLAPGCTQSVPMALSLASTKGTSKVRYAFDMRPGSSDTVALADAMVSGPGVTTASYEALGSGNVSDVDLRIGDLRHARPDQLKIELIHDGVSAVIVDGMPWAGQEMVDLIFDSDSATQTFPLGAGTMTGRVQPQTQNALDAFNGHPVAGTWTLRITDDEEGATGELRRWGIDSPQQACPGKLEIPAAQAKAASGIEQEAATLNGAVTPNGRETGLRFAFGTTDEYGETSPTTIVGDGDDPVSATFQLTGLQPGTTYHYRVEAIREGGQVAVVSADQTVTTASVPEPPGKEPPVGDPEKGDPPKPPVIDRAPEISEAGVTLAKAGKRGDRSRASFSFAVSEPAEVTAVVTRAAPGIRNGGRCVAVPKRQPRGAKSCTRQLPAAKGMVALRTAGPGTLRLSAAGLGKGRYTATLTAIDATGNASTPVVVPFTVR